MNTQAQIIEWLKSELRPIKYLLLRIRFHGNERYCPVCQSNCYKFLSYKFGSIVQTDAVCPICGSLAKHRFAWLFFEKRVDLLEMKGKKILHVAPERGIKYRLDRIVGGGYITADLYDPSAMIKMDIMDIQYPDNVFDAIYASHVVEYTKDDRKAIKELYRVLKQNGWAVFITKLWQKPTIEAYEVFDPDERLSIFGQKEEGVRQYGPDFIDRLTAEGFLVSEIMVPDLVEENDAKKNRSVGGRPDFLLQEELLNS